LEKSRTLKPSHTDSLLCAISIGNVIISGGKDGLLNVLSSDGRNIQTLRGHQASICSLALIQDK
jgi:WD40 repeat protein